MEPYRPRRAVALKPCCSYSGGKVPEAATANAIVRLLQAAGACTTINPYERILPLYSARLCFVLPALTYQSALLSSPTVSDRFLPRGPQHGFNATCDER
jgi:hypothetical protein